MTTDPIVDPPIPTLAEILALTDEERAALPPERQTYHIDQVRETLEAERAAAVKAEQERISAAQASREEQERAENARVAALQDDIRFADDIDARLVSDDEAVRKAAQLDKQNGYDRYAAGAKAKADQSADATMGRVLRDHYTSLRQQMVQQGRYPEFARDLATAITSPGNENPLVAAIEYGKGLAAAAEFERGKEEGARAERIALGRAGAPETGQGGQTQGSKPPVDPRTIPIDEYGLMSPLERGEVWTKWQAAQGAGARA